MIKIGFILHMQIWCNIQKLINDINLSYHIILSIGAEKALGIIQHLLIMKTLSKLETEKNYLNLKKKHLQNLTANNIPKGGRLNAFPLTMGRKQGFCSYRSYPIECWKF